MPTYRLEPIAARWNARAASPAPQLRPEPIAVVPLVGHGNCATQLGAVRCLRDAHIGVLSWSQTQAHGSTTSVHPGSDLGIQSALGAPDGLILLAASGVA